MKLKITLPVILAWLFSMNCTAQVTKFYIRTTLTKNKEIIDLNDHIIEPFTTIFFQVLKKEYPCTQVMSSSDMVQMLYIERQRELLSEDLNSQLEDVLGAIDCRYMIVLQASNTDKGIYLTASCTDMRTEKVISRFDSYFDSKNLSPALKKMSEKIVRSLACREICTFTGTARVVVKKSKESNDKDEYTTFCNGAEQQYKSTSESHLKETDVWELEKEGRIQVSGTVSQSILGETVTKEENGCYPCSSGRTGGRTSYERVTCSINVEGLSKESISGGVHVTDAVIELTFHPDSTYTVKIKGTSTKGTVVETKEEYAEGSCDNVPRSVKTENADYDAGAEVIIGPFPGNSLCKRLYQKNTIKQHNPKTGEEEEITFEFNFTRP
jgi:hypothetical protein